MTTDINETTARTMADAYTGNSLIFNDPEDRTRWCEPLGTELGWADATIFIALGAPVATELLTYDATTPLLRWADPDVPAVTILDALFDPPNHKAKACDRCGCSMRGLRVHRLWVPCDQSAVEVQTCGLCHDTLNDVFRAAPDAGGPAGRVLVWR
ncbi:hypothetical protein [uncultured Nocardioides sp.]|uniref:hypothetical protein n=1 Tax=uncultured Nocardioides sp. TaxID=198441 RepID=UPI00260C26CE|nr:hypothetical protein [uncultured Nocardioides sp.]